MRHFSDDRHALRPQIKGPDRQRGAKNRQHRPHLRANLCHARPQPHAAQQGLQPAAHPEQEGRSRNAQHHGDKINLTQMRPEARKDLNQRMPFALDAQNMPHLTCGDQDARCGDKSRNYWMRQKIRQKSEAKQPERQQHRT